MKEVRIDNKKILNFSEKYVNSQIKEIKEQFRRSCNNDSKFSAEYKKYVSNLDNIKVSFKPVYGLDIYLSLSHLSVDYSYDYTLSYYSTSHYSGDLKVNSNGNASISNLHAVSQYNSSRQTRTGSSYFSATATQDCIMHLGDVANKYSLSNYEDVTNQKASALPAELARRASSSFTYAELNEYMLISKIPGNVKNEIEAKETKNADRPKNFRITRITDYIIDELSLTYLPYAYKFDVWTEYEGKVYKQVSLNSPEEIRSDGPLSSHYKDYLEKVEQTKQRYVDSQRPICRIYGVASCVSGIVSLALILLLIFAKAINHEAVYHYYLGVTIVCALLSTAFTLVSLVNAVDERDLIITDKRCYNPKHSMDKIQIALDEECETQRKRILKKSIIWLAVTSVVTAGVGICSSFIFKNTYSENFWYTPEILTTYYDVEGDTITKLTIISCDNEGKVEVIEESAHEQYYAKGKYTGEIKSKKKGKMTVELKLSEILHDPGVGRFDTYVAYVFTDNYRQISNSDGFSARVDSDGMYSNLNTPEMLKSYVYYKNNTAIFIDIKACDDEGILEAVYTHVDSKGYVKFNLSGKILLKGNDGNLYVEFTRGDRLTGTSEAELPISTVACLYENFTSLKFYDKDFSIQSSNVCYVDSYDDFSSMNNSSKLFIIKNDIDFGGAQLSPIKSFTGSIVGNGYTLKNFKIKSAYSSGSAGLIDVTKKGTFIYDINIENAYVELSTSGNNAGILCGFSHGSLFDISTSGTIDAPKFKKVGGICGHLSGQHSGLSSSVEVKSGETVGQIWGSKEN